MVLVKGKNILPAIANMEHHYAENTVLQKFQRYVGLKPIKSEKPPISFFRV